MKRSLLYLPLMLVFLAMCILPSCSDEDERPTFPLSAEVFYSTAGAQAVFTALTHSATSWHWDFGDGNTSTEKNPVHVYETPGPYVIKLTATDAKGNSVTKEINIEIILSPLVLLAGDPEREGYQGKTWKLSSKHDAGGDFFAYADADFSTVDGTPKPLPTGIFQSEFMMGDVYLDEFTFFFDGTYQRDPKEDGGSFGGLVYEMVTNGGGGVINANGADYGLCIAEAPASENATFIFEENEDYTVVAADGNIELSGVMTLDFTADEFIGFRDFQRKVVIRSLANDRMQLIMFMAADPSKLGQATHALILSFEPVQ